MLKCRIHFTICFFCLFIFFKGLFAQHNLLTSLPNNTITSFKDSIDKEIIFTENKQKYFLYSSIIGAGISLMFKIFANQSYDNYRNATDSENVVHYWNQTNNLDNAADASAIISSGLFAYFGYCEIEKSNLEKSKSLIPVAQVNTIGDSTHFTKNFYSSTKDSGFVLLSMKKNSIALNDLILTKLSNDIQVEFVKIYSISDINIPISINQSADSCFNILCKVREEFQKEFKYVLLNVNKSGDLNWQFNINDQNISDVVLLNVNMQSGLNFVCSVSDDNTHTSLWLMNLNSNGELESKQELKYIFNKNCVSFIKGEKDFNYLICNNENNINTSPLYFYKIDTRGNYISEDSLDVGKKFSSYLIKRTEDLGFNISIVPYSYYERTTTIIKVDSLLNPLWEKNYNQINVHDIIECQDNGYFMIGRKDNKIWAQKVDSLGTKQYEHSYSQLNNGYGYGILENLNGSFTFIGTTKTKANGLFNYAILRTIIF